MRRRLHLVAVILFLAVLVFDLVVWGAVPGLPEVGESIARSARSEAPLATTFITLGAILDGAVPALERFGAGLFTDALADAFPRIVENPNLAMDLVFSTRLNATHGWLKLLYWAAPVLLLASLLLWVRKPKKVSLIGRR
ncbi:MAG: hypothetical protein J0L88_12815 [Xanthomonadales bacterium]|nr:hypothetical protein [Xanthomonadales bacterium]